MTRRDTAEERLLRAIFAPDTVVPVETEEQAAARILDGRARSALRAAPELVAHARSLIPTPERGAGGGEGANVYQWAPMRLTPTDDADEFYAALIGWVLTWADYLNTTPPAAAAVAWANDREAQGFRANTTPAGVLTLVKQNTRWLLDHADEIAKHQHAQTFQEWVLDSITVLRGRYPTAPWPPKAIHSRPCPRCEEAAVGAEWYGALATEVTIWCTACGKVIDAPKPSDIEKWIPEATIRDVLSEACAAGRHSTPWLDFCEGVQCECACHLTADPVVGYGTPTPVQSGLPVPRLAASTAPADPRVCPICHLYHPEGACQG